MTTVEAKRKRENLYLILHQEKDVGHATIEPDGSVKYVWKSDSPDLPNEDRTSVDAIAGHR